MPLVHTTHARVASLTALLALTAWGQPGAAAPPGRDACITAHEQAQELRKDGRLQRAQEKLVFCSQSQCPDLVKSDCGQWLGEVAESMPTMVLEASDANGNDVVKVRVLFDGREITKQLDGHAVPVDPGQHTFRFEGANGQHAEQKVVIHQGEKNRVLTVRFPSLGVASPPADTTTALAAGDAPAPPASDQASSPKTGAFVLGGVGIVALGAFAYLGATASSDVSDMRSSCAPGCEQSRVDADKRKALFADVALGVGVVALGAATYLFLSHRSSKPVAQTSLPVDVHAVRGGAMAAVGASF